MKNFFRISLSLCGNRSISKNAKKIIAIFFDATKVQYEVEMINLKKLNGRIFGLNGKIKNLEI